MAGRILVVDDEERFAAMVSDLLNGVGYAAEMQTDPQMALERLSGEHFDLVIADYKMPVMDGAELLTEIHNKFPGMPVIIISGLMNMPELIKVANIGVTLVLEKPFDTQEFLDQVARFVDTDTSIDEVPDTPQLEVLESSESEVEQSWTFPETKSGMSCASLEAKQMFQTFHECWEDYCHFFVKMKDDLERNLLLKELSRWKLKDSASALKETVNFGLGDLVADGGLKILLQEINNSGAKVVGVSISGNDSDFAVAFKKWWSIFEMNQSALGEIHFVYFSDLQSEVDFSNVSSYIDNHTLILMRPMGLSELKYRISDVAFYFERQSKLLGVEDLSLPITTVDFILKSEWKTGLNGLIRFASLYYKELTVGERAEGLLPLGYVDSDTSAIEEYLKRQQNLYLLSEYDSKEGLEPFFRRRGYAELGANALLPLKDQPLFYKDLAH